MIFEVHIPFDILVGASESALGGYVPGFCNVTLENQIPGKMEFRLSQWQLGDLGTVVIRKLSDEVSEVYFTGASSPTDKEGIAYSLTYKRQEFSGEWADVLKSYLDYLETQGGLSAKPLNLFEGLPKDKKIAKITEFSQQTKRAREFLEGKRKEHWNMVIEAYLNRLSDEPIWLVRPAWLPNAKLVSSLQVKKLTKKKTNHKRGMNDETRRKLHDLIQLRLKKTVTAKFHLHASDAV